MSKKFTDLPAAGALSGSEIIAVVKSGASVQTTAQAIADLGGDGGGGGGITAMNEQTGTSYTLALTDATKAVRCTNAAAISLTIPPHSSVALPLLCAIPVFQGSAGVATVTAGAGVTLEAPWGVATSATGDFRTLFQRAADVWVIG